MYINQYTFILFSITPLFAYQHIQQSFFIHNFNVLTYTISIIYQTTHTYIHTIFINHLYTNNIYIYIHIYIYHIYITYTLCYKYISYSKRKN